MSLDPEVRRGGNLPFGMAASRWCCDPRYSTNARTLYTILITYADTQGRDTARGKPYRRELAAQLGCSLATLDRTLEEMVAAGMLRIIPQTDPDDPNNNDCNIYQLLDAGVMWQGNGEWVDPLPPGVKAADVAKARIEQRRKEKRDAGQVRKGGVPKGVNAKAVKAARKAAAAAAEDAETGGGGSTGAATPGSTGAARVAARVLPNVYSPVENVDPDPDAPPARSAPDAGGNTSGSGEAGAGGFAASGKKSTNRMPNLARAQWAAVDEVLSYAPAELNLPKAPELVKAIVAALAEGQPDCRTPAQLGERIRGRWIDHGYAQQHADGKIRSVVGVAIDLVRAYKRGDKYGCPDPRCESSVNVDTGESCRACAERMADRNAERRRQMRQAAGEQAPPPADLPAPRTAPPAMAECSGRDGICGRPVRPGDLCSVCLDDIEEAAAAAAEGLEYASAGPAPF